MNMKTGTVLKKGLAWVLLLCISFMGNGITVRADALNDALNRTNAGRDLEFVSAGFAVLDNGYSVRAYNHNLKDGVATLKTKVVGPGKVSFLFVAGNTYEEAQNYQGGEGRANCAFYVDGASLVYENWELDRAGTIARAADLEIPAGEHELTWEYSYSGDDSPLKPFVDLTGISYEGDNDTKDITLIGNGNGQKDEKLTYDMEAKDLLPVPVRKGYVFKGWNTDKEGGGTALSDCENIRSDMTLYAIWEKEVLPVLNYKAKSCRVKDSFTLKFNKKLSGVKWTTSNKKIAAVDSKGKVKAVSKGKATISAKVGGKTYQCRVTVKA